MAQPVSGPPAPGGGPVTLINVFEVSADDAEEFMAWLRDRAKIMAAAPGFRDTRLHRAVSPGARFRFVNVAHWDSQEHLEAAQHSKAFTESLRDAITRSQVSFEANPAAYTVAVEFSAQ